MTGKNIPGITFINGNIKKEISAIKQQPGSDILVFGSPTAVHALLAENLVDEFYLFVNPVLLGQGIPMFSSGTEKINLNLVYSKSYTPSGIICLHYATI